MRISYRLFVGVFFFWLVALFSSSPILAASLSDSKLGIFILGASNGGDAIVRAGPRVVKVLDAQDYSDRMALVRTYKSDYPDGIAVLRVFTGTSAIQYSQSQSPESSAANFWNNVLLPALNKLSPSDLALFKYISGPNESDNTPPITSLAIAEWHGLFWASLAKWVHDHPSNIELVAGDIAVGNLETSYLPGLIPGLEKLKEYGGVWSYHAYGRVCSSNDPDAQYYQYRYRTFHDWLVTNASNVADVPMILGEIGIDTGGNPSSDGWIGQCSPEEYMSYLASFDEGMKQDGYVTGGTIFQIGDGGWSSFNVESISGSLVAYLGGTYTPGPLPSGSPGPTPTCPPATFTDWVAGYVGSLVSPLTNEPVGEELEQVNKGRLPAYVADISQNPACEKEQFDVAKTAKEYGTRTNIHSASTNGPIPTGFWAFISWISTSITSLFNYGNEEAYNAAAKDLPPGVPELVLNRQVNRNLAKSGDSSRVLGLLSPDSTNMQDSLTLSRCGKLPPELCAGLLQETTPTPAGGAEGSPTPAPTGQPPGEACTMGTGKCSVDYLAQSQFFGDVAKATIASRICQAESGSDEHALNDSCLTGVSKDYSVGFFQVNFFAHCPDAFEKDSNGKPVYPCIIANPSALNKCMQDWYDNPDGNIGKAIEIYNSAVARCEQQGLGNCSEYGWTPWATWNSVKNCGAAEEPIEVAGCPDNSQKISVPSSEFRLLDDQQGCMKPTRLIIHWSGAPTSADATFDTLNTRGLSCQLATDEHKTLQMLHYYDPGNTENIQRASCALGYNNGSVNIEITGVYFDDVLAAGAANPNDPDYVKLMRATDKAMETTCWMVHTYNISKSEVYGHFQLDPRHGTPDEKHDPGEKYLEYYKGRVQNEC